MAKITGIGGVFLKCKGDNAALAAWYQKHLGMQLEDWGGAILKWPDDKAEDLRPHCVASRGQGQSMVQSERLFLHDQLSGRQPR